MAQCQELPEPDTDVLRLTQDVPGIDAGEVALFAAGAACPDALIVTGDKRALVALADPSLAYAAERLHRRVLCLEQCLEAIMERHGLDLVVRGILLYRTMDSAIRCLVGEQGTTEANFRAGLISYVGHLRSQTGSLLR